MGLGPTGLTNQPMNNRLREGGRRAGVGIDRQKPLTQYKPAGQSEETIGAGRSPGDPAVCVVATKGGIGGARVTDVRGAPGRKRGSFCRLRPAQSLSTTCTVEPGTYKPLEDSLRRHQGTAISQDPHVRRVRGFNRPRSSEPAGVVPTPPCRSLQRPPSATRNRVVSTTREGGHRVRPLLPAARCGGAVKEIAAHTPANPRSIDLACSQSLPDEVADPGTRPLEHLKDNLAASADRATARSSRRCSRGTRIAIWAKTG